MNTKIKTIAAIACGVVACGLSQSARANLVSNGSFETTTHQSTGQINYDPPGSGQALGLTGWTTGSSDNNYDFVFSGTTADSAGANGIDGNVSLWGPGNGSANGFGASPDGGKFVGVDPAYRNSANALSQTVSLVAGTTYTLSFYWAAAQQFGFNSPNGGLGVTTESWTVDLGSQSQSTTTFSLNNHAFSGWMQDTMTFTPTVSGPTTLSFLAGGGPTSSEPPFDLLDGVCLTQSVPDSSSTAGLLGLGVLAMGVAAGCRRFARA